MGAVAVGVSSSDHARADDCDAEFSHELFPPVLREIAVLAAIPSYT
jgi:hypothetical protein